MARPSATSGRVAMKPPYKQLEKWLPDSAAKGIRRRRCSRRNRDTGTSRVAECLDIGAFVAFANRPIRIAYVWTSFASNATASRGTSGCMDALDRRAGAARKRKAPPRILRGGAE